MKQTTSVIIGSGSYVPNQVVKNEAFLQHNFYNPDGSFIDNPNAVTIEKFKSITGIEERRYVEDNLVTSDIGAIAAQRAIADAGIDAETLDYIIVANNFGMYKLARIKLICCQASLPASNKNWALPIPIAWRMMSFMAAQVGWRV